MIVDGDLEEDDLPEDNPKIEEEPFGRPAEMDDRIEPEPKKVDVFNDPLLPDDEDMGGGSMKKRDRADSFDTDSPGKNDNFMDEEGDENDEGEGITYDDLTKEEKYEVLQ